MMFEALVKTVDARDATVCVEALASRCMVKSSFSADAGTEECSVQSSCSNCCLRGLMQNLQTR